LDVIETADPLLDAVNRSERLAAGRARRSAVKRSAHALLPPRPGHFDLILTLVRASEDRIPALVPIRHFRMATSPFAFFRGTANVMAADLAQTPVTGMEVQLSGDAHCANFGAFATPERNTIFDVRDFDETLRGPWEWDVKRLAASLVLANREIGGGRTAQAESVGKAVAAYRRRMHDFASMSTLDIWYSRIDVADILDAAGPRALRKKRRTYVEGVGRRTIQKAFDDMTEEVDGARRFVDEPPLVYHPEAVDAFFDIEAVLANFRRSLGPDIQVLLGRYRLVDWVVKVVGVGSVGTRCAAVLLMADDNDPLILQVKEARASVLEEFLRPSPFSNHAQRVVTGQRTMQAASDIFLGWTHSEGRDYYVRQLRDMKGVPDLEDMGEEHLSEFAAFCGSTLANAHARSGQAAHIAGYLGYGKVFDEAVTRFASAYADRVAEDHGLLVDAIAQGRLEARDGS
jgi:uncharacterized protein (DUF2252 family)